MKCLIIAGTVLLNMLIGRDVAAAGKYNIGFSETFITSYMNSIGKYCTSPSTQICPDNFVKTTYSNIAYILNDLAGNQHVGAYREVIPLNLLFNDDGSNNTSDVLKIIEVYSAYNVNLTITFAVPIPRYMSVNGSQFAIMPTSDADWNTLQNTLSNAIIYFIGAMSSDSNISHQWMASRLLLEGFNEFDGLTNLSGYTDSSTAQRAAELQNEIQSMLNYYGLSVQTTTPSIGGSLLSNGGVRSIQQFLSDYYAYGGGGKPSVHLYIPGASTAAQVVYYMDSVLTGLNGNNGILSVIPSNLKGQLIISESSSSTVTSGYCNASPNYPALPSSQKALELSSIASDPIINSNVQTLLFWRLMQLDPTTLRANENLCEAFFGVATYNGTGYTPAGMNLFNYLKN